MAEVGAPDLQRQRTVIAEGIAAASRDDGLVPARQVGFPVRRAEQVLKKLETKPGAVETLPLFAAVAEEETPFEAPAGDHPAVKLLESISPDELSPREALDLLYRLKSEI
mgnify:CR=1 FL=1